MPKTRPTREQSGRSWRRWDTRSSWICCTLSRQGGNCTSYWSVWVVRPPHVFEDLRPQVCFEKERGGREKKMTDFKKWRNRDSLISLTPLTHLYCCFSTRRGIVHAAREGRYLHGGHCLVRTKVMAQCLHSFICTSVGSITSKLPDRFWRNFNRS